MQTDRATHIIDYASFANETFRTTLAMGDSNLPGCRKRLEQVTEFTSDGESAKFYFRVVRRYTHSPEQYDATGHFPTFGQAFAAYNAL